MLCSLLVRLRRGLALLALVTLALGLAGCEKLAPLTDEDVVKYIAATKAIRAVSPELADKLGKKDAAPEEGQAGFDKIDGAVKAAGFGSYADFVQVNAAIAVNFSAAQATLFMADQDDAMKKGNAQVDQALNDPNVPEATKVQLRAQMAQANEQYTKDKGFADKVMGWIKPMQDDASMAVIKKHRVELQAAMSGVAMPTEAATAPVPPAPSTPATPPTAIAPPALAPGAPVPVPAPPVAAPVAVVPDPVAIAPAPALAPAAIVPAPAPAPPPAPAAPPAAVVVPTTLGPAAAPAAKAEPAHAPAAKRPAPTARPPAGGGGGRPPPASSGGGSRP